MVNRKSKAVRGRKPRKGALTNGLPQRATEAPSTWGPLRDCITHLRIVPQGLESWSTHLPAVIPHWFTSPGDMNSRALVDMPNSWGEKMPSVREKQAVELHQLPMAE